MNNEQSKEEASLKRKEHIEKKIQRVIQRGNAIAKRRKNSMRCGGKHPRR